jgi:ribosomal protein L24
VPRIRLLVSVAGDGPVSGDVGDVLEVDGRTARVWADGVRAERVVNRAVETERAVERP